MNTTLDHRVSDVPQHYGQRRITRIYHTCFPSITIDPDLSRIFPARDYHQLGKSRQLSRGYVRGIGRDLMYQDAAGNSYLTTPRKKIVIQPKSCSKKADWHTIKRAHTHNPHTHERQSVTTPALHQAHMGKEDACFSGPAN